MKFFHKNETSVRVRYAETDQMGYCYYGNYAQFCEIGRVEALRDLGMSYKSMEEEGVMLPVSDFAIKYKAPAKYDDLLTIMTIVKELKGPRLYFEYQIINEKEVLVAEATTTLVFVSKTNMRPMAPPSNFVKLLKG